MAVPVLVLCCIRSVKQRARSAVCVRRLALCTGDGDEHQAGRSGGRSSNQARHATPADGAESFAGSNNAARSSSESKTNLARLLNSMRVAANDGGTHLMDSQRNVNEGHRKAEGSRGHRSEHEVRSAKLVAAVTKVAHSLPGKPSETESILLKQLRQHETHAEAEHRKITPNLSDIVADMKIKRTTRASHGLGQLHFDEGQIDLSVHMGNSRVFQQKRLGIFHLPTDSSSSSQIDVPEPTLWDVEKERGLAAMQEHRQQHSLDELIEWTSKGILWTFPIDNEQGLEEDQKVPFHEHIFLEHELEHFPKKGPIRHFMQLVLLGLSYNHALTVTQKREHVAWYRDYFKNKEALLQEAGTPI